MYFDRRIAMFSNEIDYASVKGYAIKTFLRLSHFDCRLRRQFSPSFANRQQKTQQVVLKTARYVPDHSKIDQSNTVIVSEKNIPWMRISVEKAVNQKLLQISSEQFISKRSTVYLKQPQRSQSSNLLTGDIFHREYTAGCVIVNRFGNDEVFELKQIGTNPIQIISLSLEV